MPEFVTLGETLVLLSPEQNGPLRYVDRFVKRIAGAESNTAIALSRLGHSCGWISRVGDDEFGQYILREVRAEGVDVSEVRTDLSAPTGLMFKQISAGSETKVYYYRKGSAASLMSPGDIAPEYIGGAKILHITGITPALGGRCLETVLHAVNIAKEKGTLISFDPNIRLKLWSLSEAAGTLKKILPYTDIFLSGAGEGSAILGESSKEKMADRLLEMGVKTAAFKMGALGCWVADAQTRRMIGPEKAGACVDPVGAGDAFNAGFLAGVLEGKNIETCGKMGNVMGAFAVTSSGDTEGLPDRKVFDKYMSSDEEIAR
jgi:2-dehydro-3-deoxygluconokinase